MTGCSSSGGSGRDLSLNSGVCSAIGNEVSIVG